MVDVIFVQDDCKDLRRKPLMLPPTDYGSYNFIESYSCSFGAAAHVDDFLLLFNRYHFDTWDILVVFPAIEIVFDN